MQRIGWKIHQIATEKIRELVNSSGTLASHCQSGLTQMQRKKLPTTPALWVREE